MQAALPGVELTALLGRGTKFEGKLYFTGRLRIDGEFQGQILTEEVLVIGEGAEVTAEIDADTVIVRGGTVTGNVRARTAIELYVPARVVGSLWAPSIFIDKGVQVEGSCTMAPLPPVAGAPSAPVPDPVPPSRAASVPPSSAPTHAHVPPTPAGVGGAGRESTAHASSRRARK